MPFLAGYAVGYAWQTIGGVATTIFITGHSWKEQVDKLDVSSTGTGQIQAILFGIARGQGNVKGNFDTLRVPWSLPPLIRAGTKGLFIIGLGTPSNFSIPSAVIAVHHQSAVEGKVEYDFDIELDALATAAQDPAAPASYIRAA